MIRRKILICKYFFYFIIASGKKIRIKAKFSMKIRSLRSIKRNIKKIYRIWLKLIFRVSIARLSNFKIN